MRIIDFNVGEYGRVVGGFVSPKDWVIRKWLFHCFLYRSFAFEIQIIGVYLHYHFHFWKEREPK